MKLPLYTVIANEKSPQSFSEDFKYQCKTNEEIHEGKAASETVPDRDNTYSCYHNHAEYHQHSARYPGAAEQLLGSWSDELYCLFRSR